MKTAIQKTDEILDKLLGCDLRTEIGIDKAKKLIRLALKEQDRDTRHACAETVLRCPEVCEMSNGDSAISPDHAHHAIMNARVV